jgi:hypothetical protein
LPVAGTRLRDESPENTEIYPTFRASRQEDSPSLGGATRKSVAEREMLLGRGPPRKISITWRAWIERAGQGAGFHATFSFAAALCDAVWPE